MAAYAIQFRRGTTTQHNSFTGLLGEVTVDTDKKTLVVHDGSTVGGFPLAREGAASTASTGTFTSNVTVGGTFAVTSTAQFNDNVTIVGDLGMTGHIIPSANVTYDLGSTTMMWRDVYVGPGSLYINGQKVLEDNSGTIKMSADANQNIKIESTGTGALQFVGAGGLQVSGEINALTGDIQFGDHLDVNSNRIKEVSAPVDGADAANKTYVDSTIASKLGDGSLSFDGVDGDFSGDLSVTGNLTIAGTTTTVNSETIELADNILLLNSNATGTASQNAGIEVERGDDLNVQFLWDETNNRWTLGVEDVYTSGSFIGDLTGTADLVASLSNHDTDDLAEGSNLYWTSARGNSNFATNLAASDTDDLAEGVSNLYFTNGRWDARLSVKTTDDLTEGSSNLYYTAARDTANFNTNFAAKDTDDLTEGTTNLFHTAARVNTVFDQRLATKDTDDLAEGLSNLFFTNARAVAALSGADTDDVAEGSSNLYYTDARATTNFDANLATKSTDDIAEGGNLYFTNGRWDSRLSAKTTDDLSEGSTNVYHTSARVQAIIDANTADFVTQSELSTAVAGKDALSELTGDSDDVSEGSTNLYFTNARAVAAVKSALSMTHSGVYVVTASDNTGNSGSSHAITAATLGFNVAGKEFYQVFLNRQLLRPTEYTVNSSNGTITFSSDVLATDDEIEAVIYG